MTLDIEALPKDAPAMVNPDPKAVATTPLIALRMHTNADVTLHGDAIANFTLPKPQIGGRKFAIQLYYESMRKHKRIDSFMGSYATSTLQRETLRFEFALPKITEVAGVVRSRIFLSISSRSFAAFVGWNAATHPSRLTRLQWHERVAHKVSVWDYRSYHFLSKSTQN